MLQALVERNAEIARGFETVVLATDSGRVYAGVLKQETEDTLTLLTPDLQSVVVSKSEIDSKSTGISAMPDKVPKLLSKHELRDLAEFLAGRK